MLYRLAALPCAWTRASSYMLVDRISQWFLLDLDSEQLEPLESADVNVLMHWFELSQCCMWQSLQHLIQTLRPAPELAQQRSIALEPGDVRRGLDARDSAIIAGVSEQMIERDTVGLASLAEA